MKKLALCTLSLAMFVGAPAFAEDAPKEAPKGDKPHHSPEDIFKKLDANGDGKLSLEELKASKKFKDDATGAEAAFKALDTDKDGFVSLEEFKAGHKHHEKGDKKPA